LFFTIFSELGSQSRNGAPVSSVKVSQLSNQRDMLLQSLELVMRLSKTIIGESDEALGDAKKQENRLRKEKAQRELGKYMKMKEIDTIEGEGCEVGKEEEKVNPIENFLEHIGVSRVILERCKEFNLLL